MNFIPHIVWNQEVSEIKDNSIGQKTNPVTYLIGSLEIEISYLDSNEQNIPNLDELTNAFD